MPATRNRCRLPACRSRSRTCSISRVLATVAGSKINRAYPPAKKDSPLIERLEAAGAVLVGALNMGEYAYDFTGENIHDGPSRNPHDLTRMTGGSSGGSGSAVGGGMVPLALGSDTNGSIRVPSSFCGIFGLKPTYGRLTRARSFPFVASLDHLGPFARSTRDLALSYDAMQGPDADDPACAAARGRTDAAAACARRSTACASRLPAAISRRAPFPRRWTRSSASPRRSASATKSKSRKPQRARAAAYVITATEGAALHLERLRKQARDFDPAVRDRLIAARHGAGDAGRQGADFPPLVSRARARIVRDVRCRSWRRRRPARRRRSASRLSRSTASNCRCGRISASTRSRSPSSACRWSPCRCRSSRCRSACRSSPRPGARTSRLRIAHALEDRGAVAAPRPTIAARRRGGEKRSAGG